MQLYLSLNWVSRKATRAHQDGVETRLQQKVDPGNSFEVGRNLSQYSVSALLVSFPRKSPWTLGFVLGDPDSHLLGKPCILVTFLFTMAKSLLRCNFHDDGLVLAPTLWLVRQRREGTVAGARDCCHMCPPSGRRDMHAGAQLPLSVFFVLAA